MGRIIRVIVWQFLFCAYASQALAANVDQGFVEWIKDFSKVAQEKGIDTKTFEMAFAEVFSPDPRILEKASYQPEFKTEIWDYLDARVNSITVAKGRLMAEKYKEILTSIEDEFGVSASVILAIWSMESGYGAVLQQRGRLHYVPRALATLAYADPKRSKFAKTQLVAALKILKTGEITRNELVGSWAGAMGHTQFIPTSYLAYGVDMDGSGRSDIWRSIPDALATAANLLDQNGWQTAKTWGYEVVLPPQKEGVLALEGKTKTLAQWQELGYLRPQSRAFPRPQDKAILKIPAGPDGPGFLAIRNFFVLKRYNNADAYALAVGLLADQIAGHGAMVQSWPRPAGSLGFEEKLELQVLLQELGYYQGALDGQLGAGSRAAVREFQQENGLVEDGLADQEFLDILRKKVR